MGSWKQLIDANWKVPYEGGWCLKYIQDAFKTDHPYGSAIEAWNSNYGGGNHPGELPPVGKTVPVYFSLGNVWQGHTAVSLDDGYIASSSQGGYHTQGYIHQNLDNIIWVYGKYNGGCTYLGWSEYVGTARVVEYVPEVTTKDISDTTILPYKTIFQDDNTLPKGQVKTSVVGIEGYTITATRIYYSDGVESGREQLSQTTVPAIDQIVLNGTYVAPEPTEPTKPIDEPTEPTTPVITPPTTSDDNWLVKLFRLLLDLFKSIIKK